ncbi:MAG TPA: ankyrin repeat domain-containing protein [Bryobacteraceae bacterium]|nr:ankyrin repeat domain-containing protein [Bryobacteraceae bacterium]
MNRPGPHGWTPLLCACYSRVNAALDTAALLLDHGADPNTFTMKGNVDQRLDQTPRRFTALTGVFGGGSTGLANQPPHPQWRELAELLLDRGANPADEETLANNQDGSLEILLRHGLKPGALAASGISLMGRALSQAARSGNAGQVRLLLAHDARTDETFNGRLPWDHAMRLGRVEIARLLEQAGAPVAQMDEVGQFVAHCMAGEAEVARAMLDRTPDLLLRAPKDMVSRAVWTKRKEAVALVLDLGFDPNWIEDNAAIHQSGVLADREEILQLLLNHGASLKLRDPWYDGTAIGAADFFNAIALRDRLLNETDICLFDALDYGRLDRVPDILARDPDAIERPFAKCLSRQPQPDDWQTPLVRMVARGNAGAVRVLLSHGANTAARLTNGRPLLEEIAALLAAERVD